MGFAVAEGVAEAVLKLEEAVLAGAVAWVDGTDDGFSEGVGVVGGERDLFGEGVVGADVVEGGEAGVVVGGSADVAEDLVVEGAPALVPEIVGAGELKEVEVGAEVEFAGGGVHELNELLA